MVLHIVGHFMGTANMRVIFPINLEKTSTLLIREIRKFRVQFDCLSVNIEKNVVRFFNG